MKVGIVIWSTIMGIGVGISIGTGYLLVRGGFMGGPRLADIRLLVALLGFIFGIGVMGYGGAKLVRTYLYA